MSTNRDFNDLDGVIEYDAVLAMHNSGNRFDDDNFYPVSGEEQDGEEESYFLKKLGKRIDRNSIERQKRLNIRAKSNAEKRVNVSKSKMDTAKANKLAAASLGKESQSDIELAKALAASAGVKETKKLSTGAKVGIGVGVALVLGIGGFLLYKKLKK